MLKSQVSVDDACNLVELLPEGYVAEENAGLENIIVSSDGHAVVGGCRFADNHWYVTVFEYNPYWFKFVELFEKKWGDQFVRVRG